MDITGPLAMMSHHQKPKLFFQIPFHLQEHATVPSV
jgi:hypothetical protein